MELRILGHRLAVKDDAGVPIDISRGQVRELLCVLAIEPDSVVSSPALIERLWQQAGGDPAKSLQQAVYNARQFLPKSRLRTEGGGYRLRIGDADYIDLIEFRRLIDQARSVRGAATQDAVALYQRALSLWGTPPLGDLPHTAGMEPLRESLLGELLDAREELVEALLELSDFRGAGNLATRWLMENPLREQLRGLLMLALNGAGRKGEALRIYRQGVALLGPGLRPGSWLEGVATQIAENQSEPAWSPRPVWLASEAFRQVGTGIDTTVPSPARIYDCLLGGKDNFAVDREAAATMARAYPPSAQVARVNRAFVIRAVRYLVKEAGIGQFIDVGSGLPTLENVHEVARQARPDVRVVYVDHDPMVCAYGRALLTTDNNVDLIQADVRHPQDILEHPTTRRLIDFDHPVAILMAAIIHFIPDHDDPQAIVTAYSHAMPPGSYLVISHTTIPPTVDQRRARTARDAWGKDRSGIHPREHATVARFFDGLTLVEPERLVDAPDWHPHLATDKVDSGLGTWLVGVGRREGAPLTGA